MSNRDTRDEIVRTLALEEPITYAGEELERLEFREPRAGVIRRIAHLESEEDKSLGLIAALTRTSLEAIAELTWTDYLRAGRILAEIMPEAPPDLADDQVPGGGGKGKGRARRRA